MFTNGTLRWCVVANGTSEGVFFDQELPGDNMVFYGNIMWQGDCQTGNTPIQFQNGAKFGNVKCYFNTFVDFSKSNVIGPGTALGSGSAVVNNLFINYLPNWPVGVDNNGFSSTGIGTNQIINSASPFVTSGDKTWVKGSGNPPATRVTSGAPVGYNPSGYEKAFELSDNSWAKGKAIAVPAGYNVDLYGRSGNSVGALQSSGGSGPGPSPTVSPVPSASPSASPSATPPVGNKFSIGDTVTPTAVVNVRAEPAGTIAGTHKPGDTGEIKEGPVVKDLKTLVSWYRITWATSPTSGWSGDDDLIKATAPTPTPPAPTPTPSQTWEKWIKAQGDANADWVRKNPPQPDQP
jgi:hypothetical protein